VLQYVVVAQHLHLHPESHPSNRGLKIEDLIDIRINGKLGAGYEDDISSKVSYLRRRLIFLQSVKKLKNNESYDESCDDDIDDHNENSEFYPVILLVRLVIKVLTRKQKKGTPRTRDNQSTDLILQKCVDSIERVFSINKTISNLHDKIEKNASSEFRQNPLKYKLPKSAVFNPRDDLDAPFRKDEIKAVASFFIFISKALNRKLKLPKDDRFIEYNWFHSKRILAVS
jgi:hypothetical protein